MVDLMGSCYFFSDLSNNILSVSLPTKKEYNNSYACDELDMVKTMTHGNLMLTSGIIENCTNTFFALTKKNAIADTRI